MDTKKLRLKDVMDELEQNRASFKKAKSRAFKNNLGHIFRICTMGALVCDTGSGIWVKANTDGPDTYVTGVMIDLDDNGEEIKKGTTNGKSK